MLRISWTEKRTNKSILDELQTRRELLAQTISKKLLSLDTHAEPKLSKEKDTHAETISVI